MQTGLKVIDKAISKFGVAGHTVDNQFQKSISIDGRVREVLKLNLPYCIKKAIFDHADANHLMLHQFYAPHKDMEIACLLTDQSNRVIERVHFGRDRKYWNACKLIEKQLIDSLNNRFIAA